MVISEKYRNFAADNQIVAIMKRDEFVITGVSRFDGTRHEISGPLSKAMAEERLGRELANRKRQRFPAYTRLRIERRLPTQLNLMFE